MLEGGAYDGVRLKDVLQMSSGARWNEDYSDPESDINRWLHILSDGGSLDAFAAGRVRGFEPGAYNRYNTTDTHVLGMVVRGATGRSLTEYFREKLWDPLGAEADAFWVVDSTGAEVAGGGLNAILRDYAKLGELYRNGGVWKGRRLLSEAWVRASVTPDAPHLKPGSRPSSDHSRGTAFSGGCRTTPARIAPSASTISSSASIREPARSSRRPRRSVGTPPTFGPSPTGWASASRCSAPSQTPKPRSVPEHDAVRWNRLTVESCSRFKSVEPDGFRSKRSEPIRL